MIDKEIQILKKEHEEDYFVEDDYFAMDENDLEVSFFIFIINSNQSLLRWIKFI